MQLSLFDDNKPKSNLDVQGKVCNSCKQFKPLSEYSRAAGGNHVRPDCKTCSNRQQKVREELKKEHPYPDEDYKCPCCNRTADEVRWKTQPDRKVWCLDHNHKTESFRGYICFRCNIAVGQCADNPDVAYNLYLYLKGEL